MSDESFMKFMNAHVLGPPLDRAALLNVFQSSHARKLAQAKAFLESIKHDHPEWCVRRKPD